jgi:Uma2 family endonuclease
MNAALLAPEEETFPNRKRWTVAECYDLMESGKLTSKFELIDGEVISKTGQKPPHRIAIRLVIQWLLSLFGGLQIQSENPISLSGPDGVYNEPEPDVAVTREPTTAYRDHHPGPSDLLLVVEVADTTLRTDLLVKSRLYARAGIAEYWILDLNARQLHIRRQPANGEYTAVSVHAEGESVTLLARPESSIVVTDLLPPVAA